ncbi:MAG: DnaJ domain-containing protein [Deltaproteobacteria bacterium]|nr:DnaJ domain-containing protein [Deltaproteobacteria bacterium]
MSADRRPKPLAEGNFTKTPFAHILVYLFEKKLSGTLEIHSSADVVTVYVREGTPAKVRSSVKGKGLGHLLHDLKLITEDQLRAAQHQMTRQGGLMGEILVRMGAVDAAGLIRSLREQLLIKLVDVFGMTDGRYAFYEGVNLLIGYGPDELFQLDPYPLLMAGARVHGAKLGLEKVLESLKGRFVSLTAVDPLKRMRLDKEERDVCRDLLGGAVGLDDLMQNGKHNRIVIRRTIYVLLITKELVVADAQPVQPRTSWSPEQKRGLESYAPPPPAPAEISDPALAALRERIQTKAAAIASQNYFEMLGVAAGASGDDVRKAFFRLAKEFHPDRSAKAGMQDLEETLEYVFSNLSEAQRTLIDPDARNEYESAMQEGPKRTSMAPGPRDEDQVRDVLEAENLFQKAVVLMRAEKWDTCLDLVDRARQLAPKEGEYLAVWAFLQSRTRIGDAPVDDLIAHLRRAEEASPKSERVHLYLGQLLKRVGHNAEAKMHFGRVIEANPRNIEAMRELRLMEMRAGKEEGNKKKGFLKRLLS